MDNEKELLDQPQSNEASIENDDFFDEIEEEIIDGSQEESQTEEESGDKPIEAETEENKEEEIDYKPFLEELSKKAKYNGESVSVDNIDDVISNFQKGLNYDKMAEKLSSLENSKAFKYVSQKAQEVGMSVDDYMNQVEEYEKEQQRERDQQRIDEMVANGVPEDVAKEVVATSQLRKELQEEKNRLEKEKETKAAKDKKDKEYAEFLEVFPDVKAEDIPKEVFLNAQKSDLKTAYLEWQNAELKKQLEINKTNSKNKERVVGPTTEYGNGEEKLTTDPFLEGFNSV